MEEGEQVRIALMRIILPQLRSLLRHEGAKASRIDRMVTAAGGSQVGMVGSGGDKKGELRVGIAVSFAHLLNHLPPRMFGIELPRLLTKVCNSLRTRDQVRRDASRKAVASIASILGPAHLLTLIQHLRTALPEGYMVHVIGHTLAAVLTALEARLCMKKPIDEKEAAAALKKARRLARDSAERSDPRIAKVASDEKGMSRVKKGGGEEDDGEEEFGRGVDPTAPLTAILPQGPKALVEAAPEILDVIMEDVFGAVATVRDPDSGYRPKFAMREAKSSRGADMFELLARCLPFLPHPAIHTLTAPIMDELRGGKDTYSGAQFAQAAAGGGRKDEGVIRVAGDLMARLVRGVCKNASVKGEGLVTYAFCLIRDNLATPGVLRQDILEAAKLALTSTGEYGGEKEKGLQRLLAAAAAAETRRGQQARSKRLQPMRSWRVSASPTKPTPKPTAADTFRILPEPKLTATGRVVTDRGRGKEVEAGVGVMLVRLGVNLLDKGVAKQLIASSSPSTLKLLTPLLPLLLRALAALRDSVAISAHLHLLPRLCTLPLATWTRETATAALRATLLHISTSLPTASSSTTSAEILTRAMRAAAALLQSQRQMTVSREQLKALVQVVEDEVGVGKRHVVALQLLHAVISRKLLSPEVYDVMDKVRVAAIRDARPSTRTRSSRLLLRFLTTYPMEDRRLRGHLDFFLRNLEYPTIQGRLAALQALLALVTRLPSATLTTHSSRILLPLLVRLVQDPSLECRAAAGAVLRALATSLPIPAAREIAAMLAAWAGEKDDGMRRAAFQSAAIFIEANSRALSQHASKFTSLALSHLKESLTALHAAESELHHTLLPSASDPEESVETQAMMRARSLPIDTPAKKRAPSSSSSSSSTSVDVEVDDDDGEIDALFASIDSDDDGDEGGGGEKRGGGEKEEEEEVVVIPGGKRGGGGTIGGGKKEKVVEEEDTETKVREKLPWRSTYFALQVLDHLAESNSKVFLTAIEGRDEEEEEEEEEEEGEGEKRKGKRGKKSGTKVGKKRRLSSSASPPAKKKKRSLSTTTPDATKTITSFLLYPHAWVRLAATRVIARLLPTLALEDLREVCGKLVGQLGAPAVGQSQAAITTQCLVTGVQVGDDELLRFLEGRMGQIALKGPMLSRLAAVRFFQELVHAKVNVSVNSVAMVVFRQSGDAGAQPPPPKRSRTDASGAVLEEVAAVERVEREIGGRKEVERKIKEAAIELGEVAQSIDGWEDAYAEQRRRREGVKRGRVGEKRRRGM